MESCIVENSMSNVLYNQSNLIQRSTKLSAILITPNLSIALPDMEVQRALSLNY